MEFCELHPFSQPLATAGVLCCGLEFAHAHPRPRDVNGGAGTGSLKAMAGGSENRPTMCAFPHTALWGCLLPMTKDTPSPYTQQLQQLPHDTRVCSPFSLSILGVNLGGGTSSPDGSASLLVPAPVSLTTSDL